MSDKTTDDVRPVPFAGENTIFHADGCGDLPAWQGRDANGRERVISCWRIPFFKRLKLLFTGRVWLDIYGSAPQPAAIKVDSPLVHAKKAEKG